MRLGKMNKGVVNYSSLIAATALLCLAGRDDQGAPLLVEGKPEVS